MQQLQQLRIELNNASLQGENFRLMLEQCRKNLDAEKRRRALAEEEEEFELRHPPKEQLSGVESTLQHHGSGSLTLNTLLQKDIKGSSARLG